MSDLDNRYRVFFQSQSLFGSLRSYDVVAETLDSANIKGVQALEDEFKNNDEEAYEWVGTVVIKHCDSCGRLRELNLVHHCPACG